MSFEDQVLEIVKKQPPRNADGSTWYFISGKERWSKDDILVNWKYDSKMRKAVTDTLLALTMRMAGKQS